MNKALDMANADVIIHEGASPGEVLLEGVVLHPVLVSPAAFQRSKGFKAHLVANQKVCPVAEENVGEPVLAPRNLIADGVWGYPPFGEVVGDKENPNGTLTLFVDGVWPDYNSDCAFTSIITVQPFDDGTFRYLSNSIEKKELDIPNVYDMK